MIGRLVIVLLRGYQVGISVWRPRCCRFVPSCSQYAIEAIDRYGMGRGCWIMIGRLLRCHPFCQGGLDPLK